MPLVSRLAPIAWMSEPAARHSRHPCPWLLRPAFAPPVHFPPTPPHPTPAGAGQDIMDSSGPKGTDASGNPILQVRSHAQAARSTAHANTALQPQPVNPGVEPGWQATGPAACCKRGRAGVTPWHPSAAAPCRSAAAPRRTLACSCGTCSRSGSRAWMSSTLVSSTPSSAPSLNFFSAQLYGGCKCQRPAGRSPNRHRARSVPNARFRTAHQNGVHLAFGTGIWHGACTVAVWQSGSGPLQCALFCVARCTHPSPPPPPSPRRPLIHDPLHPHHHH